MLRLIYFSYVNIYQIHGCFACNICSFLVLLILVSLRADDLVFEYFGSESMKAYVIEKYERQRGNPPTILEYAVLLYVVGKI